jgi:hypothetical protein
MICCAYCCTYMHSLMQCIALTCVDASMHTTQPLLYLCQKPQSMITHVLLQLLVEGFAPGNGQLLKPRCIQCNNTGCMGNFLHARWADDQWTLQLHIKHHKTAWTQNGQVITLMIPSGGLLFKLLVQYIEVCKYVQYL